MKVTIFLACFVFSYVSPLLCAEQSVMLRVANEFSVESLQYTICAETLRQMTGYPAMCDSANAILAFSFGNRILDNSCQVAGPVNEQLAKIT